MQKALSVLVKPRSKVSGIEQHQDGHWIVRVKAPPVDGKANKELIGLIAKQFQCRKSCVSIRSGASGRLKLIEINQ